MREMCLLRSMSGMWKRGYGEVIWAPPDERGGNRHTKPILLLRHISTLPKAVTLAFGNGLASAGTSSSEYPRFVGNLHRLQGSSISISPFAEERRRYPVSQRNPHFEVYHALSF